VAVELKFCGLTRETDAAFAASLGASYVGVIFAESPRRVEPVNASAVFGPARGRAKAVGVFGPATVETVADIAAEAALDVVQLHGDPSAGIVERIRPFFTRSAGLLAAVGLLGALPLMAFGRELFVFVFGPQWSEAGAMAAVMAPAAVLNLAIAPVSRVFNLTARPHLRFAFGIANLIGTIILFALVIAGELTLFQTVIGISLVTSLSYFVYFAAGWIAAAHIRLHDDPPLAILATDLIRPLSHLDLRDRGQWNETRSCAGSRGSSGTG